MAERTDLDRLLELVTGAADEVARNTTGPVVRQVRAGVRAAFECALANGLIEMAPQERWPQYVVLGPHNTLPVPDQPGRPRLWPPGGAGMTATAPPTALDPPYVPPGGTG